MGGVQQDGAELDPMWWEMLLLADGCVGGGGGGGGGGLQEAPAIPRGAWAHRSPVPTSRAAASCHVVRHLEAHGWVLVIATAGMVPAQLLLLRKRHGNSWYGSSAAEAPCSRVSALND